MNNVIIPAPDIVVVSDNTRFGPQGPQGATGIQGPLGDPGLVWFGAWNEQEIYNLKQTVEYNGSSYVCVELNQGFIPQGNTSKWNLVAAAGATGAQGVTGPQGPTGSGSDYGDSNVAAYLLSDGVNTKSNLSFIRDEGFGDLPYFGIINPDAETLKIQTNIGGNDLNTDIVSFDRQSQNINVSGNIIPTSNNTQSLGSAENQWKDLYVSNSTIYIGNVPIGIDANNNLIVNNAPLTAVADTGDIQFVDDEIFSETGRLSIYSLGAGEGDYNRIDVETDSFTVDVSQDINLISGTDVEIAVNNAVNSKTFTFTAEGKLQLPEDGDIVDSNGDSVLGGGVEGSGIANGFTSITIPEENGDIVFDLDDNNSVFRFKVDGTIELPDGGTITEDIVTDNPTINLTPANPDVESQKLIIKGGVGPTYTNEENGIQIATYTLTVSAGLTAYFEVFSDVYPSETFYWWVDIYSPGDQFTPDNGTVTLEDGYGNIQFTVNDDTIPLKIYVSDTLYNAYANNKGAGSVTVNGEPIELDPYHLHLTTGNLQETSVILGTDQHNLRTKVDGSVELTSYDYDNEIVQKLNFKDGVLRLVTEEGDEDLYIKAEDDLYLDALGDDVIVRADDDIRFRTGYNFDEGEYEYELRFNNQGELLFYNQNEGQTYATIRMNSNDGGPKIFEIDADEEFSIKSNDGQYDWTFKNDGSLSLPDGGTITEDIVTDNPTIKITPANANVNSQMLLIKGGALDDYHLHLTTGDLEETSIILGTDTHCIRTTTDGGVIINTYNYGAEEPVVSEWVFDRIGQLMFPNFTFQTTAFTGTANVAWSAVPTANSSPGTAGEVAYDVNGDLYICVAANTWSKIAGTFVW